MTDAETNRAVAEACGYDLWPPEHIGSPGHIVMIRGEGESVILWDPLHNANQAIEALDTLGRWRIITSLNEGPLAAVTVDLRIERGLFKGHSGIGEQGVVEAVCDAACKAILKAASTQHRGQ